MDTTTTSFLDLTDVFFTGNLNNISFRFCEFILEHLCLLHKTGGTVCTIKLVISYTCIVGRCLSNQSFNRLIAS